MMLPLVVSVVVITLSPLSAASFLLPLAAIGFSTFFLPCGFGNPFMTRLVQRLAPGRGPVADGFVAQLTLQPRVRTGLRALLEDADDVGWLSFSESALRFQGDSVQLSVPLEQIREVRSRNIGLRGLFVYGRPCTFTVSGLPQIQSFQVAERSSWTLPGSWTKARALLARLQGVQRQKSPA